MRASRQIALYLVLYVLAPWGWGIIPFLSTFSSAAPVLLLCLDVRGYCSRRFHVQSFGHVFQVLIKLYDKIKKTV